MAYDWGNPYVGAGVSGPLAEAQFRLPESSAAAEILSRIGAQRFAQQQALQQQIGQAIGGIMAQRQRDQIANSLLAQMQAPRATPVGPGDQGYVAPTGGGAPAQTAADAGAYAQRGLGDLSMTGQPIAAPATVASYSPAASPAALTPADIAAHNAALGYSGKATTPNLGGELALNMQLQTAKELSNLRLAQAHMDYLEGRGQYYGAGGAQQYRVPRYSYTDPNTGQTISLTGGEYYRATRPQAARGVPGAAQFYTGTMKNIGLNEDTLNKIDVTKPYDENDPSTVQYVDPKGNPVDNATALANPKGYFAKSGAFTGQIPLNKFLPAITTHQRIQAAKAALPTAPTTPAGPAPGMPSIGDQRTINGIPATWNGRAWVAQ